MGIPSKGSNVYLPSNTNEGTWIGHFVEAQILEAVGVDYVDESEVLTLADDRNHINKHNFRVPFVCGCRDLCEALRRVREGVAMIRTKGEAVRSVMGDICVLSNMDDEEVFIFAKKISAPYDLVMHFSDPEILAEVSSGLGEAIFGINLNDPKV